jgi:pyrroloquinoline quinone biosynthesis protein E
MRSRHVPRLGRKARLCENAGSGEIFLLYPERGLLLNSSAAAVLRLCDGARNVGEIARILSRQSEGADGRVDGALLEADVSSFLDSLAAAAWARELDLPLTINVVMHRDNLSRTAAIIALAEKLGADRLELANAQYLGWALANRDLLLPDRAALETARDLATAARTRLKGKMEILFVLPDYHAGQPRACMDGWAQRFLIVNPYGLALPCQAAASLPDPAFANVRDGSLSDIWLHSEGFTAFRGEAWMSPTCRTCDRRNVDFGGCRCQAFHLTGDTSATDPACSKSPDHHLVQHARAQAERPRFNPESPDPAYRISNDTVPDPVYRRFPVFKMKSEK